MHSAIQVTAQVLKCNSLSSTTVAYYLGKAGIVFGSVRLSVCVSVCLSAAQKNKNTDRTLMQSDTNMCCG